MHETMTYSIGDFSVVTGVSIDTLRYYEKEGLLRPQRDSNNRRVYMETDERWVAFLLRLKATGMPLVEIKKYSDLRSIGDTTIGKRMSLLLEQRERLDEQRTVLNNHIEFLENKIQIYRQMQKDFKS